MLRILFALSHTPSHLCQVHTQCARRWACSIHTARRYRRRCASLPFYPSCCAGVRRTTHTHGGGLTRILTPGWYNFEVKFLPIWSTCGASTRMERGAPKQKQQRERTQKSCVAKRKAKGGGCGRLARERREAFEQQNTRTRSNGLASTKPFPAFVSHGVVGVRDGRTTPQRESWFIAYLRHTQHVEEGDILDDLLLGVRHLFTTPHPPTLCTPHIKRWARASTTDVGRGEQRSKRAAEVW